MWILGAAVVLCGAMSRSDRRCDYTALCSAGGFAGTTPAGPYVHVQMHDPFSAAAWPAHPEPDEVLPRFDAGEWGKERLKPSFQRPGGGAHAEPMAEAEKTDRRGLLDEATPFGVAEESDDLMSRALQNWGWLSREVLESEWKKQEQVDAVSFLEEALLYQDPSLDAWDSDPWLSDHNTPVFDIATPDEAEAPISWSEPLQGPGERFFGAEPGRPSEGVVTLKRWKPSSAPVAPPARPSLEPEDRNPAVAPQGKPFDAGPRRFRSGLSEF